MPYLSVNRAELGDALGMLARFLKLKPRGDAIFGFKGGMLQISFGGITAKASAVGAWSGQARVSRRLLQALVRFPCKTDPTTVRVEKGQLWIGEYSIPCIWEASPLGRIELPANPSLTTILALRGSHTDEVIASSGLSEVLRDAEDRRDSLIRQAATILAPLGVQEEDIREVVEESVVQNG